MKVKYIKEAAGISVGTETNLPENLAKALIDRGIVEELKVVKKAVVKEESAELETKEDKIVSKRKTKSKK
jgi:hypothetical protein